MNENPRGISEIKVSFFVTPHASTALTSSRHVYEVLLQYFDNDQFDLREEFIVLYLNRANRIIGVHRHSSGGAVSTIVDVRIVFAIALKTNAQGIIVSHNHPSGTLSPSTHDESLTKRMEQVAKFHEILFVDHVIVTRNGYFSFADEGLLSR